MISVNAAKPMSVVDVVNLLKEGAAIPFLGAAASYAFDDQPHPPSTDQLTEFLFSLCDLDDGAEHHTLKCPQCARLGQDLAHVASYYQLCVAPRRTLDRHLRERIGCETFAPNKLHYLLARTARRKPMMVVTTNYDELLERAFDDPQDGKGCVPYEVVATAAEHLAYEPAHPVGAEAAANGNARPRRRRELRDKAGMIWHRVGGDTGGFIRMAPDDFQPQISDRRLTRSLIYKIHGSVPHGSNWSGGYVIAEEDYARFLGRLDRPEILPPAIQTLLNSAAFNPLWHQANTQQRSFLFLGYGLRDWNLRVLLDGLSIGRGPSVMERHYAVLGPGMKRMEAELLEKRNIKLLRGNLDQFVAEAEPLMQ
jgi:SIR2-like domain